MKKILIIDDAFNILKKFKEYFTQQGFEVFETGPSNTALEGAAIIQRFGNDADLIFLDMQLQDEDRGGAKIYALLDAETRKKVIGITDEKEGQTLLRSLGVTHVPGKETEKIMPCLMGYCKCNELAETSEIQPSEGKKTLDELVIRSNPCLYIEESKKLIEIARRMSPTSAKVAALDVTGSETFAKACRYLSMIRRDYGREMFEKVAALQYDKK